MEERHDVVMITGASRGLGAALAREFAAAGAKLSICARAESDLGPVCTRVAELGMPCLAAGVDVRDEAAVRHWIDRTRRELGTPAVLINNASLLGPRTPLAGYPLSDWRRVLDVNLTGTLIVSQLVLREMLPAGRGSIINVSSGAAIPPRRDWGAYAISKDALEGLTMNLAAELAGTGVRVNTVDPGAMRTDMRADAYPDEDPGTVKEPGSIAPLFLWLAGDAAADVTGERFQADRWLRDRG
ncbi:MAG: SDR family oxidoreductase [Gemmatimonadota bacterium]